MPECDVPNPSPDRNRTDRLYRRLVGEEGERVCNGLSDAACKRVPENFLVLLGSLSATKIADAFSQPGLILTWLLALLGAPSSLIGLLAPVREAGSLLPQIVLSQHLERRTRRRKFWILGCSIQGLTLILMVLAALSLEGTAAGLAVLALVGLFSLGRSLGSVTIKDLMGRHVARGRRGRLSGWSSMIAAWISVAVAAGLALSPSGSVPVGVLLGLLSVSALCWLLSVLLSLKLREDPAPPPTEEGKITRSTLRRALELLHRDPHFGAFCLARGLLASTVLSMPFYVLLSEEATGGSATALGILMLGGSAATALSAVTWGWLADHSSRLAFGSAGIAAGTTGLLTAAAATLDPSPMTALILYGTLFFLIGLSHTGIRLGRVTHLIDLAPTEQRPFYVAVSNTLMGGVLLLGGGIAALATWVGEAGVILIHAILGLCGGWLALRLPETSSSTPRSQ